MYSLVARKNAEKACGQECNLCVAISAICEIHIKDTIRDIVMCVFSSPPAPPPPDPDVEIARENQEAAEKAKKDKAKAEQLENTVAASGGGTTVPSLLTSTRGGIGYYDERL